jgi:hypothetical protein
VKPIFKVLSVALAVSLAVPAFAQQKTKKSARLFDVEPPAVVCPANQTIVSDSLCEVRLDSYMPLSVTDNQSAEPAVLQSPAPCTLLKGHNASVLVTLIAIDDHHNPAACTFTVTLVLTEERQVLCGEKL